MKTIDIEALSKMPITKQFAELLFGEGYLPSDVTTHYNPNDELVYFNKDNSIRLFILDDGCMGVSNNNEHQPVIINNAFAIVNYIDSYLNNRCEYCGRYENINVCICGTDY